MTKLRDWLMQEYFTSFSDDARYQRLNKMLDEEIVLDTAELKPGEAMVWPHWREQHIVDWVQLANGWCVAFNENPSRGWSFPFRRLPETPVIERVQIDDREWEYRKVEQ